MSESVVTKKDTDKLSAAFTTCYEGLVDQDDKDALMGAFRVSQDIIGRYAQQAVASEVEAGLLRGKNVQMKLALSNVVRAVKSFKEASA
jgi:hypothetical protein